MSNSRAQLWPEAAWPREGKFWKGNKKLKKSSWTQFLETHAAWMQVFPEDSLTRPESHAGQGPLRVSKPTLALKLPHHQRGRPQMKIPIIQQSPSSPGVNTQPSTSSAVLDASGSPTHDADLIIRDLKPKVFNSSLSMIDFFSFIHSVS